MNISLHVILLLVKNVMISRQWPTYTVALIIVYKIELLSEAISDSGDIKVISLILLRSDISKTGVVMAAGFVHTTGV